MGYQDDREKRIEIFEDTLRYCERNKCLLKAVQQTRQNTVLYKEPLKECSRIAEKVYEYPANISVSLERTLESAYRLHSEYKKERIGVLNFASATNPGGGVIRGSNAQEESICRSSSLYPCLTTPDLQRDYYAYHKAQNNPLYSDACIFAPGVIVFKTDNGLPELRAEKEWFSVDVISCAAPNLRKNALNHKRFDNRVTLMTDEQHRRLLEKRIRGILQVAVLHHIDILVLGAFGCGAFCNSPYVVAEVFKEVLKEFEFLFKEICFAVYCTPASKRNYNIFRQII